jgi:aquaporin Z
MACAVGDVSGANFNLAVSIGLWAGGQFEAKDLLGYI